MIVIREDSKKRLLAAAPVIAAIGAILYLVGVFITHILLVTAIGGVLWFLACAIHGICNPQGLLVRKMPLLESAQRAIQERESGTYPKLPKSDIVIESSGEQPIKVIQALSKIYALSLKDANDMAERIQPWVVKKRVPKAEAEFVKLQLEAQGAKVQIVQR